MSVAYKLYAFSLKKNASLTSFTGSCIHELRGTKGDNGPKTDLGAAVVKTGKEGEQIVEVELPNEEEDLDESYERLLRELVVRPEEKHQSRDATTKQQDYYKVPFSPCTGYSAAKTYRYFQSFGQTVSV